jgi:hypothetical protein
MNGINAKTTLEDLAILVSEHLQKQGLQIVLVGGAVVTIYSENEYQSHDLDFISPNDHRELTKAMLELGFTKQGKNFVHANTSYSVEFPSGPVAIGNEIPVKPDGEISNKSGKVKLLSPTQCVMDRLAWFYHYNDRQCLDQALAVARHHKVNFSKIKKWSAGENCEEKFEVFMERLKPVAP